MSEIWEDSRTTIAGRCLCGSVNYAFRGYRSMSAGICHCSRCRKMTGSAYVHFTALASPEQVDFQGEEYLSQFAGTHGLPEDETQPIRSTTFCVHCGSCVPKPLKGAPEYQSILAGTVPDMPVHQSSNFHFYTKSKCPWVSIPESEPQSLTVKDGYQNPDQPDLERYVESGRITGSCLCGEVSFAARHPIGMMNCHCSRCRLARGAAHATNLFVLQRNFEWLSGQNNVIQFRVPDAERFTQGFCGDCGSPVPRPRDNRVPDDRMGIPAGCLDSDPGIKPAGHIFVGSKAPWFAFFDDLPQWKERPDRSI